MINTALQDFAVARDMYEKNGLLPSVGVVESCILDELDERISRVIKGEYLSGIAPRRFTDCPDVSAVALYRTEYPQLSDPGIAELIKKTGIGEFVLNLMAGKFVQAWFIHTIQKNPGFRSGGDVGWHQDGQYTKTIFSGDFISASISLSDVEPASGPVRYVAGSHRWPLAAGSSGSGFSHTGDLRQLKERLTANCDRPWNEIVPLPRRGAVTLHHSRLLHGSGTNLSSNPRKSIVMHLRTDRNLLIENTVSRNSSAGWYQVEFDDFIMCPTLAALP